MTAEIYFNIVINSRNGNGITGTYQPSSGHFTAGYFGATIADAGGVMIKYLCKEGEIMTITLKSDPSPATSSGVKAQV